MKRIAASLVIAMGSGALCAQPIVDIKLVQYPGDGELEIYVRPHADFDEVVSTLTFTLRWPMIAGSTIGQRTNDCPSGVPFSATAIVSDAPYFTRTYNAFGTSLLIDEGCPWSACEEHRVMVIDAFVDPGYPFEIMEDNYFVSLNGIEATGSVYSTEPCLMTGMDQSGLEREGLAISPNPVRDEVLVGSAADIRALLVHGPDGRLLRLVRPSSSQARLDLTGIAPGMLVVTAQLDDGCLLQRRVMKY